MFTFYSDEKWESGAIIWTSQKVYPQYIYEYTEHSQKLGTSTGYRKSEKNMDNID